MFWQAVQVMCDLGIWLFIGSSRPSIFCRLHMYGNIGLCVISEMDTSMTDTYIDKPEYWISLSFSSLYHFPSSLYLADNVPCVSHSSITFQLMCYVSVPTVAAWLLILISVWGLRLSFCCRLLFAVWMPFPSEQQIKILVDTEGWHRRVIGLRTGGPGATLPYGWLPHMGNWLLLLLLLLRLAPSPLISFCVCHCLFSVYFHWLFLVHLNGSKIEKLWN